MKKILFYISQFNKGGAELSLLELIKSLDCRRYDIDFIVYNQVPVSGAVSLIQDIPRNVHICNVFQKNQTRNKLIAKIRKVFINGELFDETAVRFVSGKKYDLAVHVGEWHAPDFMALVVNATKKVCWVHADIDKIREFDPDAFFSSFENIDCYYFVSEHSKKAAENKYPFLHGKTGILHNSINEEEIIRLSSVEPDIRRNTDRVLFVSLGNIREEKGYIRSLEALIELKKKGFVFDWWIIGHPASGEISAEMEERIKLNRMDEYVRFLGARTNPYCLLKQADAVLCLSDNESWSLVITESKLLKIPVIATDTSGAREQIENRITGIITSFDPFDIANELAEIIKNPKILSDIRRNLSIRVNLPDATAEIVDIISAPVRSQIPNQDILFVIDDVSFPGGAHKATFKNINYLVSQRRNVSVLSNTLPTANLRNSMPGVCFYSVNYAPLAVEFRRRLLPSLFCSSLTRKEKRMRVQQFVEFRRKHSDKITEKLHKKYVKDFASRFDYVCVMSEGSTYKEAVSQSQAKKKIQWIHTDYCKWRLLNDYTLSVTKDDYSVWRKYDRIVLLSERFISDFIYLYPELASKCTTCGNIIDADDIRKRANERVKSISNTYPFSILVDCEGISRQEIEKAIVSLKKLDDVGYPVDCIFFHAIGEKASIPDSLSGKVIVLEKTMNMAKLMKGKDLLVVHENNTNLPRYDLINMSVQIIEENLDEFLNYVIPNWNIWLYQKYRKVVSFVSCFRFEPIKQPLLIIEALKRLKECGYDFHWTFIGDGEQLEESKELAFSYDLIDEITFLGHLDNPFPFVAKADFYVMFSKYEGLPNTVWEALSLGIPVITADIGAVKDQVEDGVTGIVIEPKLGCLIDVLVKTSNPDNRAQFEKLRKAAMSMDFRGKDEFTKQKILEIFSS